MILFTQQVFLNGKTSGAMGVQKGTSANAITFGEILYVFYTGNGGDGTWFTTTADGQSWTAVQSLRALGLSIGVQEGTSASACVFGSTLYMFYTGNGDDGIWFTTTADGKNWTQVQSFVAKGLTMGVQDGTSASAVVLDNTLYLFYTGNGGDGIWFTTTTDGENWAQVQSLVARGARTMNVREGTSPNAVAYGNTLYLFFTGSDGNGIWFTTTQDGNSWTDVQVVDPQGTVLTVQTTNASALVFENKLHVFYKDEGGDGVFYTATADGSTWDPITCMAAIITQGAMSGTSPWAVDYDGLRFVFWTGLGGDGIWYSSEAGVGLNRVNVPTHISPADARIVVNGFSNMLDLLGTLLTGGTSSLTTVTKGEAETLIRNAITEFRSYPEINTLDPMGVNTAIDRVFNQVYSDVSFLFNEEVAQDSLGATSQVAMAAGQILSAFPPLAAICDAVSLLTLAPVVGIEIDLHSRGTQVFTAANGMKTIVDSQLELAPAAPWNAAQRQQLLVLGQLNAGIQTLRADASLNALLFVIDQQTPGLDDDQLFSAMHDLCVNFNDLSGRYPDLPQKIAALVGSENPQDISATLDTIADITPDAIQLGAVAVGSLAMSLKLGLGIYRSYDAIKQSYAVLMRGKQLPAGAPLPWTKEMKRIEVRVSRAIAAFNLVAAGFAIWRAIQTEHAKEDALAAIAANRDAIKNYYWALIKASAASSSTVQ